MTSLRRWAALAAVAVALLSAVGLALALTASPASAFTEWQHDGATGCSPVTARARRPTPPAPAATPASRAIPDMTCWSCHAPGQDTSTLSVAELGLQPGVPPVELRAEGVHHPQHARRRTPTSESSPECLSCHPTSVSVFDPGSSPHHSGQAAGFSELRHLPLVAAEARRQGRLHQLPHDRAGVPPLRGEQPRLQELRRLPHHEARRQEGRRAAGARSATRGAPAAPPSTPRRSPRSSCAAAATPRSCTPAP